MRRLLVASAALSLAACDFDVVNPGPLQDATLDNPAAHAAMVNGAGRQFATGLTWVNFLGGVIAREMFPSGSTAQLGITLRGQAGKLPPEEINTEWQEAHRARWLAESFLERFEATVPGGIASYAPAAQLLVWAGYANRLLGENMCVAVFDTGPAEPYRKHLERAEAHFTRAFTIATAANQPAIARVAQAGRASVRAYLGNWTGAVSDASAIPSGFAYTAPYDRTTGPENRISMSQANEPHRSLTVWNTVHEAYYTQTGDPRSGWMLDPDPRYQFGSGARDPIGQVPFRIQLKYCARGTCRGNSPITLSSYAEMRLILAEDQLVKGNVAAAMQIINAVRASVTSTTTRQPLAPWPAANLEQAWAALKRERGIVLWLEGRRLGDLRRWEENKTPGALHPLEVVAGRDQCFPPSQEEVQRNTNLGAS
jgi:hypothetical protein